MSSEITDEYDRYCAQPTIPEAIDAIQWWLEPTQQRNYPNLNRMALDLLSIPAMSTEPERVFSSVQENISDRRNQAQMDLIEVLELLKSWIKLRD